MKTNLLTSVLRGRNLALVTVAMAGMVTSAYADPTIQNGSFSNVTYTHGASGSYQIGSFSGYNSPVSVNSWSSTGYNFVFTSGDNTAPDSYNNALSLYGPPAASPNGGNYVALDSDYGQGAFTTTVSGLTVGQDVTVSFYFAGAQQVGYTGTSNDWLTVNLGTSNATKQTTATITDSSESYTGWTLESFTFDPTSTSETLSFLAGSSTPGVPSFALLDGVSVETTPSSVPEPGSLALLSSGLIGLGGLVRSRFKK